MSKLQLTQITNNEQSVKDMKSLTAQVLKKTGDMEMLVQSLREKVEMLENELDDPGDDDFGQSKSGIDDFGASIKR